MFYTKCFIQSACTRMSYTNFAIDFVPNCFVSPFVPSRLRVSAFATIYSLVPAL